MKINPSSINWINNDNYLFISSQQKAFFSEKILKKLNLKSHLFIMTSGTKGRKCIALSKKAFLCSAKAVNQHLKIQSNDKWLIALPLFHTGGLAIPARCFLSQSPYIIYKKKWSPSLFLSQLKKHRITLTSLVPAQVYDLVSLKLTPPQNLRAVLVGGGALHKNLYLSARKLNWPVLPSYGLTEAGSTVAIAPLSSLKSSKYPDLKVLKHCKVKIQKGRLALQSSALLTGQLSADFFSANNKSLKKTAHKTVLENPVQKKWLMTEDQGEMKGQSLKVFGRCQVVKIKGESVSLYTLENILQKILLELNVQSHYSLLAVPHPRTGCQIHLISDENRFERLFKVYQKYNKQALPCEQVKNVYFIKDWPSHPLFKVKEKALKKRLGF